MGQATGGRPNCPQAKAARNLHDHMETAGVPRLPCQADNHEYEVTIGGSMKHARGLLARLTHLAIDARLALMVLGALVATPSLLGRVVAA